MELRISLNKFSAFRPLDFCIPGSKYLLTPQEVTFKKTFRGVGGKKDVLVYSE